MSDPFIDTLLAWAEANPDVLGVVLAGSSAETERRDRWSDHDVLVVTVDGTPEHYRTDLSWLPDAGDIAFSFRETAHGLKVVYRSGMVLEFAVFDRAEFEVCALNHYAVALDRADVTSAAARLHDRTMAPAHVDRLGDTRSFLSLLLIGTARAMRGEHLSANVFLRTYAPASLLRAAADLMTARERAPLDVLDPWRRVEQADPTLAAALDAALAQPVERVGLALLDAVEPWLAARWPDYPAEDVGVVRGLLTGYLSAPGP